ncbi:LytR/AlgR family response regulator transcription factor [Listeria aquatica]|uniref:LytR/AlgR family response regulator transcription factor n=1 Tax=Listeria aquatica TaxID=1494960 RepID=UPI003EF9A4D1
MLKVYVCEDDLSQREKITKIIKNYLLMQDLDVEFAWAGEDPEKLLNHLMEANDGHAGLFFLDVDLKTEMNGIALGGQIRKEYPDARIVFVTAHAELTHLTFFYKVEAMDYILKGDDAMLKSRIISCIDVAVKRYLCAHTKLEEYIIVESCRTSVKLLIKDILFIESSRTAHRLVVHLNNRLVEYYGKIKDVERQSTSFYRCHQSFVVNIKNVHSVSKREREIVMNNGESCYASVRYLKGLLDRLNDE